MAQAQPSAATDFDVVFVGGGLASVLGSLALHAQQPELRIALVEREPALGGNHTWCFHAADVPRRAASLVEPLIVRRWPGYEVRFPHRERRLASAYACISSAQLDQVGRASFARARSSALLLGATVTQLSAHAVRLADGRELQAKLVIDARGPCVAPEASQGRSQRGYQKFVGLELAAPGHGLSEPIMFDARVAQHDGFRFMYTLPLSDDRLLIEETFFSDGPELDQPRSERAILAYAASAGLHLGARLRTERGVLPMPWQDPDFDVHARPLSAGYRAGLFHPVTGYSLPLAVRFALALADSNLTQLWLHPSAPSPLSDFARAHAAQRPFLRLLTRLLFTCFAPDQRYGVLEHFYRLPEPIIERFYAAELSSLDRARVFIGAPPRGFSVGRALRLSAGVAP